MPNNSEVTSTSSSSSNNQARYVLPLYDCDGRNIDDKDYTIPSPPERDISGHWLTLYNTGSGGGVMLVTDRPGSTSYSSGGD
jgi:hypothetical protein